MNKDFILPIVILLEVTLSGLCEKLSFSDDGSFQGFGGSSEVNRLDRVPELKKNRSNIVDLLRNRDYVNFGGKNNELMSFNQSVWENLDQKINEIFTFIPPIQCQDRLDSNENLIQDRNSPEFKKSKRLFYSSWHQGIQQAFEANRSRFFIQLCTEPIFKNTENGICTHFSEDPARFDCCVQGYTIARDAVFDYLEELKKKNVKLPKRIEECLQDQAEGGDLGNQICRKEKLDRKRVPGSKPASCPQLKKPPNFPLCFSRGVKSSLKDCQDELGLNEGELSLIDLYFKQVTSAVDHLRSSSTAPTGSVPSDRGSRGKDGEGAGSVQSTQ